MLGEIDNHDVIELNFAITRSIAILGKAGFKPIQPRVPAGNSDGGQLTETGGGSANTKKPVRIEKEKYKPDEKYKLGIAIYGKETVRELHKRKKLIEKVAKDNDIDPNLIKGVITNERITRQGGGETEAFVSAVFSKYGTYGPAQLGPQARHYSNLSIEDALTYEGAIIGAGKLVGI